MNTPQTFPEFSTQTINEIINSLPRPLNARRRELLPSVLQEWSQTDLRRHLSLESNETRKKRFEKQVAVKVCAKQLLDALQVLDRVDRTSIILLMAKAEGRSVSRSEFAEEDARLLEESLFLKRLSCFPEEHWKAGRGRPRNYAAYLVVRDAATIFEWYSGILATREVDRDTGKEINEFYNFTSTLWPIIFHEGTAGLSAAMKNWAEYDERSALIANMNWHHPTWGLYAD
jgi:hypothetical protein